MPDWKRPHAAHACLAACLLLSACGAAEEQPASNAAQPAAAQPETNPEQARRAILNLEREWAGALSRKDLAWYERHVAPEYRTILSSGRILPRAGVIETVRTSPPAQDVRVEQADARIFGDTAVAIVTQSFTMADGKPGRLRLTDVWRRSGGRWMAVHSHETVLGPEQAP